MKNNRYDENLMNPSPKTMALVRMRVAWTQEIAFWTAFA